MHIIKGLSNSTWRTVIIIHVEEKSMPCENVHIQGNLSIKGIHGKPVFNCGDNCTTFLTVPFWKANDSINREERTIILQNLKISNTRCHSSLISIFHSSRIIFENVTVRDSDAPAIKVFQLDHKPIFINEKNSDFLSSYGMFMAKCNNMALLIKKTAALSEMAVITFKVLSYATSPKRLYRRRYS